MKTRLRSILERIITYGLVAFAIGGLVYFFGSVNEAHKNIISKKENELKDLDLKAMVHQKDYENREKLIAKITEQLRIKRQEVKEKFEKLLESSLDYTLFIEQIQRKARALEVQIQSSDYTKPFPIAGAGGNYLEFEIAIKIYGIYNKVKQFLWEIENSLGRMVKISSLEIVPPISTADGYMSMKLTLSTFFLP